MTIENSVRKLIETAGMTIKLRGTSMLPVLKMGDLVRIEKVMNGFKIGDIVLFYANGEFILHRIVYIYGDYIITKGDHNQYLDTPMKSHRILGVAVEFSGRQLK